MSVKFNINDQVKIKLTPKGKQVFYKHYRDLKLDPDENYKPDWDGRITMELWNVMHIFGAACYNGCEIPFETEVEFK